jgi:CRP/FNR family cyclic AMP-dependent transcriptional regulator
MEGKVVGECASELKRLWATLMPSLGARKLCLDLRGVLYLDGKGKQVLQEIVEAMAAEILADSPQNNSPMRQGGICRRGGKNMQGLNGVEPHQNCQSCKLKENGGFFCHVSPAATKEFESIRYSSVYPAAAMLFLENEASSGVFMLCSGEVKLSVSSSTGKTLILRIAKPGEILGLTATMSGVPYEASAETLRPCQIVFIRRDDFSRFVSKYPEVYQAVIRQLNSQYNHACEQLRTVGLSCSAHEKLARLLLHWSSEGKPTNEGTQIKVPLTHEQIAECVGSTRETITRTLSEFKHKRLIEIKGATMLIPSRAALEAMSGA